MHRCKTIRFQTQRLVLTQGELFILKVQRLASRGNRLGTVTLKAELNGQGHHENKHISAKGSGCEGETARAKKKIRPLQAVPRGANAGCPGQVGEQDPGCSRIGGQKAASLRGWKSRSRLVQLQTSSGAVGKRLALIWGPATSWGRLKDQRHGMCTDTSSVSHKVTKCILPNPSTVSAQQTYFPRTSHVSSLSGRMPQSAGFSFGMN